MWNRIGGAIVYSLPPAGIMGFRIIIPSIDPDPCVTCVSVRHPVPGALYPAADHIRLKARCFCQRCECAGKAIAVSRMGREHVTGGFALPSADIQVRIFCGVAERAAGKVLPACVQLLVFGHMYICNGVQYFQHIYF